MDVMPPTPHERKRWPDLVLVLLLAGFSAIWCWAPLSDLELTHFDEGGYALGALAVSEGRFPEAAYPHQHWLSPPFLFWTAGLVMRALGHPDVRALFGVVAFFGTLLAPLVYILARAWFGLRRTAFAAGILVSFSPFHVAFATSALTDVPFVFFFLLALLLFTLAERRRNFACAIAAGLATGLAWNTKYHGWLALVLAGLALVPQILRDGMPAQRAAIMRLAAATGIATACFLPWFLYVETCEGGYLRLAEEHARFLKWSSWPRNLWVQFDSQACFALGWAPVAAWAFSFLAITADRIPPLPPRAGATAMALAWLILIIFLPLPAGAGVVALFFLPRFLRRLDHPRALAAGFFVLFSILTPCYTPYARLLLPWATGAILLAAAHLSDLHFDTSPGVKRRWIVTAAALVTVAAGMRLPAYFSDAGGLAVSRFPERLEGHAGAIARQLPARTPIAVLGEPAVVFELRNLGHRAIHIDDPGELAAHFEPGTELGVVTGIYARKTRAFIRWQEAHPGISTKLATVPFPAGVVRLLDDMTPAQAREIDLRTSKLHDLDVWRVRMPMR